jgi:hypothetical protein
MKKYFYKKLSSKFFYIYLVLEKMVNIKYFLLKKNLVWFLRKYLFYFFNGIHFLKVVKKIKNIMLFINYIKFGS